MPICLKSIPVSFFRELEEVDHRANLPVSDERWQQLTHVLADDPVLKQLHSLSFNVAGLRESLVFLCVFDPILICVRSWLFKVAQHLISCRCRMRALLYLLSRLGLRKVST